MGNSLGDARSSACLACQSAPAGEQRTQSGSINFSRPMPVRRWPAECLAAPDAKTYILGTVVRLCNFGVGSPGRERSVPHGVPRYGTVLRPFDRDGTYVELEAKSPRPRSLPGSVYFKSFRAANPRCPHGRPIRKRALLTVRTATA